MQVDSLRFKLSAGMAVLITLVVSLLTGLGWFSSKSNNEAAIRLLNQSLQQQAEATLNDAAGGIAEETSALINRNFDMARSLSALLSSTAHGSGDKPYSRERVQQQAGALLRSNEAISALYAQFEANGYDQLDSQYDGTVEHSSKQGTMEIYWVRDGQNVKFVQVPDPAVKYVETRNQYGVREAEWYLCSRDSLKPCLMEPYLGDHAGQFGVADLAGLSGGDRRHFPRRGRGGHESAGAAGTGRTAGGAVVWRSGQTVSAE